MTSGDAAQVAIWTPVEEWWRAACTNGAGGHSSVCVDPIASPVPGHLMRLNAWVARIRNDDVIQEDNPKKLSGLLEAQGKLNISMAGT